MRKFLAEPLRPEGLSALLKLNLGLCLFLFAALEFWRPYFFLTDDNLSQLFPLITEIGRHLQAGRSPFISDYIFGGGYDLSRDMDNPFWHPFYLLPSLLADTPGRYLMLETTGLLFLLLTVWGFTLLANALVKEFNPKLPAGYVTFLIFSCTFSSYVFMVGSSWIWFLGNLSALPWLTLGILEHRLFRSVGLIAIFSVHEIFSAYIPSTFYNGICLSLFALGIALIRRSPLPAFTWAAGNIIALLLCSPFLLRVVDGLAHSTRLVGVSLEEGMRYRVPAHLYPFSYFLGNWTDVLSHRVGDTILQNDILSHASALMACAAAWCIFPALGNFRTWRKIEITLIILIIGLVASTVRPMPLATVMHHLPFIRSLRWPFRECLQLLFFVHLFLLVQRPSLPSRTFLTIAACSLAMFLLPLPFVRVPTLNWLKADREEVLSGRAERFWSEVKPLIKPDENIATMIDIDLWKQSGLNIPYSLTGTANFPALYRVRCISGYSATAPMDEVPLKTVPGFWFGAFHADQLPEVLKERPDVDLIIVQGVDPLRIVLQKDGKTTDLSPYLRN